jgi:glycosyltransferase involved in cell wall biosynthesis
VSTVLFDLTILGTAAGHYGIGRYTRDLVRGLADLDDGPELRLVTRLPLVGTSSSTAVAAEGLEAFSRPRLEPHARWAWRVRLRASRAARRLGADLVHATHAGATPLGMDLPRVVTCHDLIPLLYPAHYGSRTWSRRWWRRAIEWRRYRSATHVVAISRATADDLVRLLGMPAQSITVVYSGVDPRLWSAKPRDDDAGVLVRLGVAGRYLLYVGGDDWRKNMRGMLEVLAALRARPGCADVQLVWAGRPAPARRGRIEALARDLGVADAFVILGYVSDDDLAALYRQSAFLLLLSRYEGFGYPLVEAMACGCPVVTSGASSLGELAGDAALQVPLGSPTAIAQAVAPLLHSGEERARLAAVGLARARRFTLASMASGAADVYRHVLGRG